MFNMRSISKDEQTSLMMMGVKSGCEQIPSNGQLIMTMEKNTASDNQMGVVTQVMPVDRQARWAGG